MLSRAPTFHHRRNLVRFCGKHQIAPSSASLLRYLTSNHLRLAEIHVQQNIFLVATLLQNHQWNRLPANNQQANTIIIISNRIATACAFVAVNRFTATPREQIAISTESFFPFPTLSFRWSMTFKFEWPLHDVIAIGFETQTNNSPCRVS